MRRTQSATGAVGRVLIPAVLCGVAFAACSDQQPLATRGPEPAAPPAPSEVLQAFECTASTVTSTVSCKAAAGTGGASGVLIGGQGTNVQVTATNTSYNSGTEIWQADFTVQNLLNEAIGTPDGVTADPEGIQVFFHSGPTVTGGSGNIAVANEDGTGTFTAANQPYFAYNEILSKDEVSAAKTWQISVEPTVTNFSFILFLQTDVQYLLVINEVMVNPANFIASPDTSAEWFEVYNAGSRQVNLQGLVIADSAGSGRRPYHLIGSSLVVASGGYVVLGNRTNTTTNGGATVDYGYGTALQLSNTLDAVKISRVYGTDTLTLDRTQYASAAISAKDGISRELENPSLDNSNMDGSNWSDALATAVYGPGGRGTPKAQNSTFTP